MISMPGNVLFPQAAAASLSSSSSSSGNSNTTSSATDPGGLNANSFITLLTTQLQAQDPLNPMDPSQMVSELTQMNTFEQLLQIRQDMDALVGLAQGGGSGTSGGSGANSGAATAAASNATKPAAASAAALNAGLQTALGAGLRTASASLNSATPLF